MTDQELEERLAKEPAPIREIYRGMKQIIEGADMLGPAAGTPWANLRDNAVRALAELEAALEFEAAVQAREAADV